MTRSKGDLTPVQRDVLLYLAIDAKLATVTEISAGTGRRVYWKSMLRLVRLSLVQLASDGQRWLITPKGEQRAERAWNRAAARAFA